MVRVSSPAKLRPWSELTAKMVMGVVPGLANSAKQKRGKRGKCGRCGHKKAENAENADDWL